MCNTLSFLILTIISFLTPQIQGDNQSVIWGSRQPGDIRLFYKICKEKNGWMYTKAVEDVVFPEKNNYSVSNITYIEATKQEPDNGSLVTILDGGVGFPRVTLHFKSTRTQGFNYILQIFGYLKPGQPPQQPPAIPPYGWVKSG